jgi:prevent-host-death family protein
MSLEVDLEVLQNATDLLLNRVEEGETLVITRNGEPVADLVPISGRKGEESTEALDSMG